MQNLDSVLTMLHMVENWTYISNSKSCTFYTINLFCTTLFWINNAYMKVTRKKSKLWRQYSWIWFLQNLWVQNLIEFGLHITNCSSVLLYADLRVRLGFKFQLCLFSQLWWCSHNIILWSNRKERNIILDNKMAIKTFVKLSTIKT